MQRKWCELSGEEQTAIKIGSKGWFEGYLDGFIKSKLDKKKTRKHT